MTATPHPVALGAGEYVAFEHDLAGSGDRDLYAVSARGGRPTLLWRSATDPHWSPDGSRLAFLTCLNPPDCTTAFAVLDRATGRVRGFPMPDTDLFTPCALWAPSGRVLSCEGESERHPQRNGIYTIRASDGKGLTRVTKNPDGGIDSPLAYSPDGGRLLFDRSDPSRRQTASHALFVAPVSGGSPTRITPWGYTDDNAGWSPDGGTVVFGTNGSLYRVSPSGAHLSRIPLGAGPNGDAIANAFDVSFSPNGRRIVFSVGLPAPRPGIYIAQVDGGDVTPLATSSTEDHHATWGPSTSG